MRIVCENCKMGIIVEEKSKGEDCWKCGKFVEVKEEPLPDLKDI